MTKKGQVKVKQAEIKQQQTQQRQNRDETGTRKDKSAGPSQQGQN